VNGQTFIGCLRSWSRLTEEEKKTGDRLHQTTGSHRSAAECLFAGMQATNVTPHSGPLALEDPQAMMVRAYLWAFFQAAKSALDSLGREINLVYWGLDDEKTFFEPATRARWTTFYSVRQKLLLSHRFRNDAVACLLDRRTSGPTADAGYRALSHWANVGLVCPLTVGPIEPRPDATSGALTVAQSLVWLPDDPRSSTLTYAEKYEVSAVGEGILQWLGAFVDEVYQALEGQID
jgi:hypothetical protein